MVIGFLFNCGSLFLHCKNTEQELQYNGMDTIGQLLALQLRGLELFKPHALTQYVMFRYETVRNTRLTVQVWKTLCTVRNVGQIFTAQLCGTLSTVNNEQPGEGALLVCGRKLLTLSRLSGPHHHLHCQELPTFFVYSGSRFNSRMITSEVCPWQLKLLSPQQEGGNSSIEAS